MYFKFYPIYLIINLGVSEYILIDRFNVYYILLKYAKYL